MPDHASIRSARLGLGREYRLGPVTLRDAFFAAHEGNTHLQADRQPKGRPALARPHEDRKHGQISRC